jgi:anti-sigma B factor antagonist/stage II sporulation protein AA (anti-sigma F factor antagonist)
MKIDKSLHDDYATLTLKGDFDTFYCPALMQEVDALIDRGVSMLILDMHVVKFINSTALGAVIKAHKRCRAEGGDLVVAQPSAFVKNVMKSVGIDKLIGMHETLAEATKAIVKQLNQRELAGTGTADHEKVLITFPDEVRNRMIPRQQLVHTGTKSLVGQMANVDGDRVQFTWSFEKASMSAEQGKELFFSGSDAHLKFQVKLIKKSYFEVDAVIANAEATADGMRVTAHFKKIADGDRDALAQFAADMAFLKRQLPGK